jgi:hypothetical protein
LAAPVSPYKALLGAAAALGALALPVLLRLVARPGVSVAHGAAGPGHERLLHVPHGGGDVIIDGDTDDPAWTSSPGPARTGGFVDASGARVTPASEARLLWGDGHLYVLLYAADEDVRSRGDAFGLTFTREGERPATFAYEIAPSGAAPGGVHLAREIDGTIDDARDRDEEWVAEMAVPLAPMGIEAARGATFGFSARRGGAGWAGRVVLE